MIVALEGFTLPSRYIAKEMTIMYDNNHHQHFQFSAPLNFNPTPADQQTIKYATERLNQLFLYDDNLLPYNTLDLILQQLVSHTIYVNGSCAYNFLKSKLPFTNIIDIGVAYNFQYPKTLPASTICFKQHNPRYCSASKTLCIKQFLNNLKLHEY